jgi:MauM/NapG family ferredoxin protein
MGWLERLRRRLQGDTERGVCDTNNTDDTDDAPPTPPAPQAAPDHTPIDRAAFLREGRGILQEMGARLGSAVLRPAVDRIAPALVRPPGALPEPDFFTRCTRCDACVTACHQGSILRADGSLGLQVGTPYLDLEGHMPCYLCARPPCAAACPTGALLPLTQQDIRLGTAHVLTDRCLTWQGQPCTRCATACPIQGAVLTAPDGRVVIDDAACVGCGLCYHACPTDPPALRITPIAAT